MGKIKITQIRRKIGSTSRQKKTLEALGLKKVNSSKEHEQNSVILGMVEKVNHLVTVEQL